MGMHQVPPVLQDEAALNLKEKLLSPDILKQRSRFSFSLQGCRQDGQSYPIDDAGAANKFFEGFLRQVLVIRIRKAASVGSCDKSIGNLGIGQLGNDP